MERTVFILKIIYCGFFCFAGIMHIIKPDFFVKGYEYKKLNNPNTFKEKKIVEKDCSKWNCTKLKTNRKKSKKGKDIIREEKSNLFSFSFLFSEFTL